MPQSSEIHFQWQNLNLRRTIYPFREQKLRDFLIIYKEIDLWAEYRDQPVPPHLADELTKEHTRLEVEQAGAELEKKQVQAAVAKIRLKYRDILRTPEVKQLDNQINLLERELHSLNARKKVRARQVDWYDRFAPEHPYYEKWKTDLALITNSFNDLSERLDNLENQRNQIIAPYLEESTVLDTRYTNINRSIEDLKKTKKALPGLSKNGDVTRQAVVSWLIQKYKRDLERAGHDQLLQKILERFEEQPGRFPKWLQYMVIHFSGMRYRSAHGSWADPRDLVKLIRIDDLKVQILESPETELLPLFEQAVEWLEAGKLAAETPLEVRKLERQQRVLNSSNRRQELLKICSAREIDKVDKLSKLQVLDELRAIRDRFPPWAWKEIVSRTELRLETNQPDWETLSKGEQRERWLAENNHWRELMNAWTGREITGWRKEHSRTLDLIVTRAVCNEIAEHIQHLRGLDPAPGLTHKVQWYSNRHRVNPDCCYFVKPTSREMLLPGASIFFLGWTTKRPNEWQVAQPAGVLQGLPRAGKKPDLRQPNRRKIARGEFKYEIGQEIKRISRLSGDDGTRQPQTAEYDRQAQGKLLTEWLRWTHEATVVEIAEMSNGVNVLTFETGQIGLNVRPLRRLLDHWDIYVGYSPPGEVEEDALKDMLNPVALLPEISEVPVMFEIEIAYTAPLPVELTLNDIKVKRQKDLDKISSWNQLTLRQQQVIAMVVKGYTTREIATQLDTSQSNVRTHISRAMAVFGVHTRTACVEILRDWDFSSLGPLVK